MRSPKLAMRASALAALCVHGCACMYLCMHACVCFESSGAGAPSDRPVSTPDAPLLELGGHSGHVLQAHVPPDGPLDAQQPAPLVQPPAQQALRLGWVGLG